MRCLQRLKLVVLRPVVMSPGLQTESTACKGTDYDDYLITVIYHFLVVFIYLAEQLMGRGKNV